MWVRADLNGVGIGHERPTNVLTVHRIEGGVG